MKLNLRLFATCGWAGLAATMAMAQVTLNPIADARIFSEVPNTNLGSDGLGVYTEAGAATHTLLMFDYSSLAGQQVLSATLRFHGFSDFGSTNVTTTNVYLPGRAWTENQVTWLQASSGNAWTNAGGDFVGTTGNQGTDPFASTTGNMFPFPTTLEFDVTSLVIAQVQGSLPNTGMMLTGVEGNYWQWASREAQSAANFPELVLRTQPVPEPSAILTVLGFTACLCRRRRRS